MKIERIKELAEEADFVVLEDNESDNLIEWEHNYDKELLKFVELIVRECVGVVEGGSFLHDQAPTAIFARECSSAIKRHFGVE